MTLLPLQNVPCPMTGSRVQLMKTGEKKQLKSRGPGPTRPCWGSGAMPRLGCREAIPPWVRREKCNCMVIRRPLLRHRNEKEKKCISEENVKYTFSGKNDNGCFFLPILLDVFEAVGGCSISVFQPFFFLLHNL